MLQCGLPQKPTRHAKTELSTFTRCSSSIDTSALSTRRSLTQSFTATRTSLTGESALGHDDGLLTTHARAGPSCTSQWTNTEVQGTEVTPTVIFPKFSCPTRAVERHVKLVTEAATAVCGQNSQDGFIRVRVASQQLMPTFESNVTSLTSLCNCL